MDKIKAVVFDWDGVIVDTLPYHFETYAKIEEKLGGTIVNGIVKDNDDLDLEWTNHYIKAGFNKEEHFKIGSQIYREEASKRINLVQMFPGIKETLKQLNNKFILSIISNAHSDVIKQMLNKYGISDYFDHVTGGEKITKMKPNPQAMFDFIEKTGLTKEEVIYVGDMDGDIKMANNAGVKSIAVGYGWHSLKKLSKENPSFMINKPEELLEVLQ